MLRFLLLVAEVPQQQICKSSSTAACLPTTQIIPMLQSDLTMLEIYGPVGMILSKLLPRDNSQFIPLTMQPQQQKPLLDSAPQFGLPIMSIERSSKLKLLMDR